MTHQNFLNQVSLWDTIHLSGPFASNGVVAVRVTNVDPVSDRLARLVRRYGDPAKLPAAHIRAILPAINDLPPALVFAPNDWNPAWLVPDGAGLRSAGLHLISTELYEIITGNFKVDGDFWNYRCVWEDSEGEAISVVMVYDFDLELVGFCCGLKVDDRNQEAVKAALLAALTEANDD